MANARAGNFPVYLAEGTCNASHQAEAPSSLPDKTISDEQGAAFRATNRICGSHPAPEEADYTSARAGWRVLAGSQPGAGAILGFSFNENFARRRSPGKSQKPATAH